MVAISHGQMASGQTVSYRRINRRALRERSRTLGQVSVRHAGLGGREALPSCRSSG